MSITLQELVDLGDVLNREVSRIRAHQGVDGEKLVSAVDVISVVLNCTQDAGRKAFKRLQQKVQEAGNVDFLSNKTIMHRFDGQCGRSSPAVDIQTMLRIIQALPGPAAERFRKGGTTALFKCLQPDQEFVDFISDRHDAIKLTEQDLEHSRMLVHKEDKEVIFPSRVYDETFVYVRVRLPHEYLASNSTNRKKLTACIIKFGITYNLQERNAKYIESDMDDGFVIYSFKCSSRSDAKLIETILKSLFCDMRVLDSYEYVDARQVADFLGVAVTPTASDAPTNDLAYQEYLDVATKLACYIVRTAHHLWHKRYDGLFGCIYTVAETPVDVCASASSPLKVRLSFPCTTLTADIAQEMGMLSATLLKGKASTPTPSHQPNKPESTGSIISRNIITGVEETFENCTVALRSTGMTRVTCFKTTYLNRPRILGGRHWRTAGNPFWAPHDGFRFNGNPMSVEARQTIDYVCARPAIGDDVVARGTDAPNEGECGNKQLFIDNMTVASILFSVQLRSMRDWLNDGKVHMGYVWSMVHPDEAGTWHTDPSTWSPPADIIGISMGGGSGRNGRCQGKVIARNVITGEEVTYNSILHASKVLGVCPHALQSAYLDKPRQLRGKHLRTFDATTYWQPPTNLIFDDATVIQTEGYVLTAGPNGDDPVLYEGLKVALIANGLPQWMGQRLNTSKDINGRYWTRVSASSVGSWLPAM